MAALPADHCNRNGTRRPARPVTAAPVGVSRKTAVWLVVVAGLFGEEALEFGAELLGRRQWSV